jgi:hypothetical protein
MTRETGVAPQFDRLITEVERARTEWNRGNKASAESILLLVASIACGESLERGPHDPVPERA